MSSSWEIELTESGRTGEWSFDGGQAWPGPLEFGVRGDAVHGAFRRTVELTAQGAALAIEAPPRSSPADVAEPPADPALDPVEAELVAKFSRLLAASPGAGDPAVLEVTLRDGFAVIPFESEFTMVVEVAGARLASVDREIGHDDPACCVRLRHEGRATVVVRDVPGYLPSTPVTVALRPGAATSVTIPLRRRS